MILLGYTSNSYRCYDFKNNKIIFSRDVTFQKPSDMIDLSSTTEIEEPNTQHENEPIHTNEKRRSNRKNKGIPPNRYGYENIEPKYMNWYNKNSQSCPSQPNEDSIHTIESINSIAQIPSSYNEAMNHPKKEQWLDAMSQEIQSINNNNTWTLCDLPEDRKPVGCKWLFTMKNNAKGEPVRFKARLVAQGFSQKFGVDYNQIFAPVAKQSTFRILLSIASQKKYNTRHLDIKTAFLYGKLNEIIFMKQPPGFELEGRKDLVCHLQRSSYGLKQAPLCWNNRINEQLMKMNFNRTKSDQCLYHRQYPNGDETLMLLYVDDILIISNSDQRIEEFKTLISQIFEIHDLGEATCYLGIQITKFNGVYHINQESYIRKILNKYNLTDAKVSNVPISTSYDKSDEEILLSNNNQYREMIGSLLYISLNTRPDIAAAICILAQKVSCPSKEDLNELRRVIKYLKGTSTYKLPLKSNDNNTSLYGYCDANYGENKLIENRIVAIYSN